MTAWANFVVSGGGGCTCCNIVPASCYLNLPPPLGDPGYMDFAEANNVITTQTDNCLAFAEIGTGGYITSLSASTPAPNTAWVNYVGLSVAALSDVSFAWVGCQIGANTTIDVTFSSVTTEYLTDFYYSNGGTAGQISGASGSLLIPDADNIAVRFAVANPFGIGGPLSLNVNITSPNSLPFCSIRANYDTGGGIYDWLNC